MTVNMRNAVEQAAYEAGRAAAKYEMLIETSIKWDVPTKTAVGTTPEPTKFAVGKYEIELVDAKNPAKAPKAPKATSIARGVKKAGAPRTKGVKERILGLLASGVSLSTADIISSTGDKETSVAGTLQGLKKKGFAAQDENKLWHLTAPFQSSNSEVSEYADS